MSYVSTNQLRMDFSIAMSAMYQDEVPLYGDLLELVIDVNKKVLDDKPILKKRLKKQKHYERIARERHGAIRLGTADELFTMHRLFKLS